MFEMKWHLKKKSSNSPDERHFMAGIIIHWESGNSQLPIKSLSFGTLSQYYREIYENRSSKIEF